MDRTLPFPRYDFYMPNPMEDCATRTPWEWIRVFLQSTILFLTVAGNLLVIISIVVVRVLRQPKNYLILNLAVADLFVGLLVLPFKIALTENCDIWKAGVFFCYLWISGDIIYCTASILGLTIISLDRYVAISHPLFYRVNSTRKKAYLAIAFTWILSIILTIPHWAFTDLHLKVGYEGKEYALCMNSQPFWNQIVGVVFSFFLPICIMLFVYGSIWRVLMLQKSRLPGTLINSTAAAIESMDELKGLPTPTQCILCRMAYSLQEKKGCIMMGIVIGVFMICWVPFFTLMLVNAAHGMHGVELIGTPFVFDTFIWLGYFNSCANPFIYTMFNQDFRFAFKELICLRGSTINSRIRNEAYSRQMGNSDATCNSTISSKVQRHQITHSTFYVPEISSIN